MHGCRFFVGWQPLLDITIPFFLHERDENGKLKLTGGAGGATCLGGAIAIWPPIWAFIFTIGVLGLYRCRFASVTTMSIALIATGVFIYRAAIGICFLDLCCIRSFSRATCLSGHYVQILNDSSREKNDQSEFDPISNEKKQGNALIFIMVKIWNNL